jgi:hypothetical protein
MIDLGQLTEEETAELFKKCAGYLSEEALFRALEDVLSKEQKDELSELWFNLYRKR